MLKIKHFKTDISIGNEMNILQKLSNSSNLHSLGYAISNNSTILNNSLVTSDLIQIADAIFENRNIESICWAFGAWKNRAPCLDYIQEMCNIITLWIYNSLNYLSLIENNRMLDSNKAAVWAVVINTCTEMIYQTVHWEPFTPNRFLGTPEIAAGLPCPSGCGNHLQVAHGGVCDARCVCGIIVEEKKTKFNIDNASGKIASGVKDSSSTENLAKTYFLIHTLDDGSFYLEPNSWKRVDQKCCSKFCNNSAIYNTPGSKEGKRCNKHKNLDDQIARNINTYLEFDKKDAKKINDIDDLFKKLSNSPDDLIDAAANCLYICQCICLDVWKKRDLNSLNFKQRQWTTARVTNWNLKVRKWFKIIN